jgi:hypothetical protein
VDDDLMAGVLMRMWVLASGHVLPDGPPDKISEEDLIEFWADDMDLPSGSGHHVLRLYGSRDHVSRSGNARNTRSG